MSRWLKHHEGPLYRVAILNRMSGHITYYGPYSQPSTAKGVRTSWINSYWNKRREVPNIGWIEETQTQWYRLDD
jgi:hypothetical protein